MWPTGWNPPTSRPPKRRRSDGLFAVRPSFPWNSCKPDSVAFRLPGKSAAISLTRLTADFGPALPPFRCGTNPELPRLRGTGGPPVTPARPCTIRGLSFPAGCPAGGGLLPRLFTLTLRGQSHAGRYFFCDTFRQPRLASRLPPVSQGGPSFGVRTFLPPTHPKVAEGRLPEFQLYLKTDRPDGNLDRWREKADF